MSKPGGNDSTDVALIDAIGRGSEDSFVELYRRRRDDVYRFALAMSKATAVAEDVTQDVFLNVLEHAARFDARKGSVRAWLLGTARHRILDRLRHERRAANVPAVELCVDCDGEQHLAERERHAKLHDAILALPIEYREAIVLCELEELSYAEAAAVMACPIGTVRSRLHRARARLVAKLGPETRPVPAARLNTSEVCP